MDCKEKMLIDELKVVKYLECCERNEGCVCADWNKEYLICEECLPYNCCSNCEDLLCDNHDDIIKCNRCERIVCEECEYEVMSRCYGCEENVCCEKMTAIFNGDESELYCHTKCDDMIDIVNANYEPLPKRK